MLKHIQEHCASVIIAGIRNVSIEKPEQLLKELRCRNETDLSVQFLNAGLIATWEHLYFAVLDSLTAFGTNRNISKNLSVEIMLYASAQRQIKKAIRLLGVSHDCADIAVVVVGKATQDIEVVMVSLLKRLGKDVDDSVLDLSPRKMRNICKAFAITETEFEVVAEHGDRKQGLVDIIIERMALLATRV